MPCSAHLLPCLPTRPTQSAPQPRLAELLGKTVKKVDDCIGDVVANAVKAMSNGEVRQGRALRQCAAASGGEGQGRARLRAAL